MRALVTAALVTVVTLMLSCAQDLASLAPFPCASDGTCPGGFGCNEMQQCVDCHGAPTNGYACGDTCVDLSSDAANCGKCGSACPAGIGQCSGGACVCENGMGVCPGPGGAGFACVDLSTDTNNCGTCETACSGSLVCAAGKCACTKAGEVRCGTACADPMTDLNNCGSCGHACAQTQVCSNGSCGCPAGEVMCSPPACVDLATDPNDCGKCGVHCPATQACNGGTCGCAAGWKICSGTTCADVESDSNNCGDCGTVCPSNMTCQSGHCACPKPAAGGTCDVLPACGCGAGEKCALDGANEACVSNGTVAPGGSCSSSADCEAGAVCESGVCDQLCAQTSDCTGGANFSCVQVQDGNGKLVGWGVCSPHCNPVAPDQADATHAACGPGQTCDTSSTNDGTTFCEASSSASPAPDGSKCQYDADCQPGSVCIGYFGTETTGTCQPWCETAQGCSQPNSTCISLSGQLDGTQPLGYCGVDCDPANPSACPTNSTCIWAGNSSTACYLNTQQAAPGAPCQVDDQCAPGAYCSTGGTCVEYCIVAAPACLAGGTCHAVSPPWVIRGVQYGYCQ